MELLTIFEKALDIVLNIRTLISLVALVVVLGAYLYYHRTNIDRKKLKDIPENERADVLIALSDKYRLKVDNLTREQRYNLVKTTLDYSRKNRQGLFIFISVLAIIAVIAIWLLNRHPVPPPIENISISIIENGAQYNGTFQVQFLGAQNFLTTQSGLIPINQIPGDSASPVHFKINQKGYISIDTVLKLQRRYEFKLLRITYWIKGPEECVDNKMDAFREFFNKKLQGYYFLDESSKLLLQITYSGDIISDPDIKGNCRYQGGHLIVTRQKKIYDFDDIKIASIDWIAPGGNPCDIIRRNICDNVINLVNSNKDTLATFILDKKLLQ